MNSMVDTSLFFSFKGSYTTIVLVYVDDIIVTRNNKEHIYTLVHLLNEKFSIKCLGDLSFFLGKEFERSTDCIHLCLQKYIYALIIKAGLDTSKPCNTPMVIGPMLSKYDGPFLQDHTTYRSTIRAL